LGNLIAGFSAIHFAAKPVTASGPMELSVLTISGLLVLAGMILDSVDGSVARLTGGESELGQQLDSLADLVTFGVAPAFILLRLGSEFWIADGTYAIVGPESGSLGVRLFWGIAVAYVACTALRLARYNVETDGGKHTDPFAFRGLPSPAAAGTVVSLVLLQQHLLLGEHVPSWLSSAAGFLIPAAGLLCAIAMVSTIPYQHMMNLYLRGRRQFAYIVRIVIFACMAIWWFYETLAVIFTFYALAGPVLAMVRRQSDGDHGDETAPPSTSS